MPRLLVIHAGFHKTGTTSIQHILKMNRPLLRPVLRSILRPRMKDVVSAARGYSTYSNVLFRTKFRRRFRRFLSKQPQMPNKVLCLSAEELSGHMPGRRRVSSYTAAIALAEDMTDRAKLVFPETEVILFYSTRSPEDWLASAYSQQIKSSGLTMEFDEFATRYRDGADLDRIVEQIADAVPAEVITSRLEDTALDPFGPATRLLDICGVPQEIRGQMIRPEPANQRPNADVMDALLDANRSIKSKTKLKAVKAEILASAREVPS